MPRQSKNRGGAAPPRALGVCDFVGISMDPQGSRRGGLTWQVLGSSVPLGSTRLYASIDGGPNMPLDRYETSAGDLEETPELNALLGGGNTVTWYLEYRDGQGELICRSGTTDTPFPSD